MRIDRILRVGIVLHLALFVTGTIEAQSAPEFLAQGREALREGVPRYDQDRLIQAADSFRRALDRNPRYAVAHLGLAEALLWLEDYEQAEEHLRRARDLHYSEPDLDLLEARLMVLTDRLEDARALYRNVLQRQPYNQDARVGDAILSLASGATDNTLRALRDLEQRFPENRQLLTALVQITATRGETAASERYLRTALRYHNDVPSVHLVAARRALGSDRPDEAELHARNVVALAPTLEEGYFLLAQASFLQGKLQQARRHYDELIRLNPENHRAWYARGVLADAADEPETAYTAWARAQRIRPDYELARLARENTLIRREPLDSPLRATAAERYRTSGRSLEERFLNRQAERHYRRGLQINPFDTTLRRGLADLYLAQDLRGRYLQELEIIAEIEDSDREVKERIETFHRLRRDSLTRRWSVDQFTSPRARTEIAVFYRQSPTTPEPQAGHHVSSYIASLLHTSQNISVTGVEEARQDHVRTIAAARDRDADLVLILGVHIESDRVQVDLELIDRRTGDPLVVRRVQRTGIGHLETAGRDVSGIIADHVPSVGVVIERRFEMVLISIGTVDGIEPGKEILFRNTPRGNPVGTGTVTAVDDLLAEVRYVPQGPDTLTTGAYAQPAPADPAETPATPTVTPVPDQPLRPLQIVKDLFRVR